MENWLPFLAILLILVFIVYSTWWRFHRANQMIQDWAARNRFLLLQKRLQIFRYGPFWWRTGKHQLVYHVTIRDCDENIRRAWLRCGGFFLGMMSDHIDVEWEK